MDSALEVAVAGEHGAGDDIAGFDGFGDFRLQGTGVADAIVYGDIAGEERLDLRHGNVKDLPASRGATIDDAQAQGRQRQRLLVDTVAFRVIKRRSQRAEPVAHAELLEELSR